MPSTSMAYAFINPQKGSPPEIFFHTPCGNLPAGYQYDGAGEVRCQPRGAPHGEAVAVTSPGGNGLAFTMLYMSKLCNLETQSMCAPVTVAS